MILIQTSTYDQILSRMKSGAHDVMIVSRKHTQTSSLLKVPQPHRLIITSTQYPWKSTSIGMELHCAHVIQMTQQGEKTPSEFVIPHFEFVVVSTRDYVGFDKMKVHAADGAVVFLKAVDDSTSAIIPSEIERTREIKKVDELDESVKSCRA